MAGERRRYRLPRAAVQGLDALVAAGLYVDRQDAIRDALRLFLPTQGVRA